MNTESTPLLIIGTYWPSGSTITAQEGRSAMQKQAAELIMKNNQHTPIVLGDMNATLYDNDRYSGKCYTSDILMYRNFLKGEGLSPVGAEHDQANPNDDGPRQWTHQQATSSTDAQGNTTYSHGRIDDILMKTNLAKKVPFVYTCANEYQSNYIPLVT
jgi:exonuclease III